MTPKEALKIIDRITCVQAVGRPHIQQALDVITELVKAGDARTEQNPDPAQGEAMAALDRLEHWAQIGRGSISDGNCISAHATTVRAALASGGWWQECETFGEALRELRVRYKVSLRDLANALEARAVTIGEVERGKRPLPAPKEQAKTCGNCRGSKYMRPSYDIDDWTPCTKGDPHRGVVVCPICKGTGEEASR